MPRFYLLTSLWATDGCCSVTFCVRLHACVAWLKAYRHLQPHVTATDGDHGLSIPMLFAMNPEANVAGVRLMAKD
jgi:hypothetical protein